MGITASGVRHQKLDSKQWVYKKKQLRVAGAWGFGYWGKAPAVVTGMYFYNSFQRPKSYLLSQIWLFC